MHSAHMSTSGSMTQNPAVTQEPSLKCSQCSLLFKSKVFLFEHLNKVHNLDVDAALTNAGLKHSETHKAATENVSSHFENQSDLRVIQDESGEHEKPYQKGLGMENGNPNQLISEKQKDKIIVVLKKESEAKKQASSATPAKSTSNATCTTSSSKDLKTYKRPLQTITKYLVASTGIKRKPPVLSGNCTLSLDGTKETLILQDSPSNSNLNSSGVFKVTAVPTIDIPKIDSTRFLMMDPFPDANAKPAKPQGQLKETHLSSLDKRPNSESSGGPPVKKAKSNKEANRLNSEREIKQPPSNTELSFEFSEDEEEWKLDERTVYTCKHCDLSGVDIRTLSTHYQNSHPHIRYTAVYLQDSSDQSATYRCLKCPIEFSNEAELKKHYTENHPEMPNPLSMQSNDLSLAFKCFVCPFTTNVSKALRQHHKTKHPNHVVENSLMYYRYLASGHQEEDELQLNECGEAPSPERTREISPESASSASREVTRTSSPQPPTSTAANMALYQCNNCEFRHKSVVVMHVHYQKSHPEETVSIDTIKQLARVPSLTHVQAVSDTSADSVMLNSKPTENDSDSHKSSSKDKRTKKRIKLLLRSPVHNPVLLQARSESPRAVNVDSEEDSSTRKKMRTKRSLEALFDTDDASNSSPKDQFHCMVCSFSSSDIASVVGHHNKKHTDFEKTHTEEIALYSVAIQKKKLRRLVNPSSTPLDSRASKRADARSVNKSQFEKESDPYVYPENLFYCQKCNFANPTVKGVLNHQAKIHINLKLERECILRYTSIICDQIKKSKSQNKSSASQLPLPVLSEVIVNPLFCRLCNFRSSSMEGVLKHYCTRHPLVRTKSEQIRSYSAMVLEKIAHSHPKTSANQGEEEEEDAPLEEKGEKKKKKKKQPERVLESPVVAPQTLRSLKCPKCPYNTQHVYLLKRHVWQIHKIHRTVTEVLKMCYKQGSVQAGYHCEMCVFSRRTAEEVFDHYIAKHPKRPSLEYIVTRLYVGPDSIKIKSKNQNSDNSSGGDATDDSLPSQSSGKNDTKTYSCKACSFKSDSPMNMTHHYRAVHPWSVKEDGSVLDFIHSRKPTASKQFEDQSDLLATFETYQEPLEFENTLKSPEKEPRKKFKCQLCSVKFYTEHHLRTHFSLTHHQDTNEEQIQTSVHVFKCLHCTYVNTNHHGVLTHCQMMHPGLESSPKSLLMDGDHLNNMRSCLKKRGQAFRLSGYMCKTCPQIYATLGKLHKHCRKNHSEANSVPSTLKPLSISKNTQAKIRSNHGFISKSSFLRKTQYVKIKCQLCSYKSTTKMGLSRHMLLYHNEGSVVKDVDPPYKCALCSNSYYRKKRLGNHYFSKHGKESFTKFFLPLKKQLEKKSWPTHQDLLLAQRGGNSLGSLSNTTAGQNKVMVFMCPYCSYVNGSFHGVLTHCQMRHPDFTARADQLKSVEIRRSDMIGGSNDTSVVARGFRCKKCPQIHPSIKKLKMHLENNHGQSEGTTSKLVIKIKTKKQPDFEFQHSVLEALALKNDASEESNTESDLAHQLETPQVKQSNTSARDKEELYECHICSYTACYRRYLQSHYRKYHKIDVMTTFKLLQKYNKRKPNKDSGSAEEQSEESFKCKLCPDSMFRSSELLLDHFRTAHNSDQIVDFTILSRGSKRTTGLYKCTHCHKQLNGIRKMCYHLDRHREGKSTSGWAEDAGDTKTITSDILMTPTEKPAEQAEVPVLKAVEDLSKGKETPVETASEPASPLPSPAKRTDQEQPEEDSSDDIPTCKRCGRTFMSLKGLRSHERSHEALAAIKKHTLPSSIPKNRITRYIIYKPGTTKPFVCSFCSYRTNVMVLWRRHFMKNHQDVIANPEENEDQDEESAQSDAEPQNLTEESFPELDEERTQKNKRSQYSEPPDVQRQLNQYNMIAQAGASAQAAVKENMVLENSVLYCDLCNFNTEHLSSIRRHYLNRHGKKMLKCKDCSFYTGSRKTLETHLEMGHSSCQSEPTHRKDLCCPFCLYQTKNKNSMIDHIILHREERLVPIEVRRPKLSRYLEGIVFRCHNCTFTCGTAENLHLHMMKHDDIKPYKCRLCFFDCTRLSDLEAHLSEKHQVVRNHELVGQVSLDQLEARDGRMPGYEEEPLSDPEHLISGRVVIKTEEITDFDQVPEETQDRHPMEFDIMEKMTLKMEDDTDDSLLLDLQNDGAKLIAQKDELDQQEQAVTEFIPEQRTDDLVDQSICEGKNSEDCNSPEEEQPTNEEVAQTAHSVDEASVPETHTDVAQDGEVERMSEGDSSITSADNMNEKKSLENNIKTPSQKDHLSLGPNCAQLRVSHVEGSSVSLEDDPVAEQRNRETRDPYGEMPVLENEYFKKQTDSPGSCKEEDQSDHPVDVCTDEEDDSEGNEVKDADTPHVSKGSLEDKDSGNEKHCLLNTEDKQFTCDLCGRNLMNSSDLQHHVVRHGL